MKESGISRRLGIIYLKFIFKIFGFNDQKRWLVNGNLDPNRRPVNVDIIDCFNYCIYIECMNENTI